jgi:hypothetical protein
MLEVSAWRSLKNDLEAEGQECKGGGGCVTSLLPYSFHVTCLPVNQLFVLRHAGLFLMVIILANRFPGPSVWETFCIFAVNIPAYFRENDHMWTVK